MFKCWILPQGEEDSSSSSKNRVEMSTKGFETESIGSVLELPQHS